MNIADAKEQIKDTVEAYLEKDEAGMYAISPSRQRPIFLLGAPGIGKTAIMEQIATELSIGIVSYSMTHHTRQSALGLPRIVERDFEGYTYEASEYTMSEIVAAIYDYMRRTTVRQGILFLDEINCVSETLYPSMLAFLQFKTFGAHKIPNDWIIVCAGNPPEYNRSVHEFDIVTLDRLREIDVEPDYTAWRHYAVAKGIHSAVTTFLEAKRDCFYKVESKPGGGKSFVTCRGWEDLAETITIYEQMGKSLGRDLFAQFLRDDEVCDSFTTYYALFDKYRSDYKIESILTGQVDADVASRARSAEFDERLALMGLLLDSLSTNCRDVLEHESIVIELRNSLREAKPKLLAGESLDTVLVPIITRRERMLARKIDAKNISNEAVRRERLVIGHLKDFVSDATMHGASSAQEAFEAVSALYAEQVDKLDPMVKNTNKRMDFSFDFIESYFQSREMIVFVAELSARQTTTQFIAHYGNDKYYAHNSELQVDERHSSLSERIAALDIEADSDEYDSSIDRGLAADVSMGGAVGLAGGSQSIASGYTEDPLHKALSAYYDGKAFEWGFASMSKMSLPEGSIEGKTVLDIACRRGKGAIKFAAHVKDSGKVIGIDWSPSYIEQAKADTLTHRAHNIMEFYLAYPEDLMEAGIGTDTIDIVYINNVCTLLADQKQAFREFRRVLRPGGLFLCETVLANKKRDEDIVKQARVIGNSVQAARTKKELVADLEDAGFSKISFLDAYDVEPDEGFKPNRPVKTVDSDENVKFQAVVVHAYK